MRTDRASIRSRLTFVATGGLLLAAAPAGDQLRFAPAGQAELSKTFSSTYDLTLDEFSVVIDGQDLGEMLGTPDVELTLEYGLGFGDTYVESDRSRPLKLVRRFGEATMNMGVSAAMMGESQEDSTDGEAGVSGHEVVFTWNPKTSEYDLEFAEGDSGDRDLLAGLTEETDLRMVLPQGDVSVDDTWEFDAAPFLLQMTAPSGDLKFEIDGEESDPEIDAMLEAFKERFEELATKLTAGSGKATYKGMVEADGAKYGSIDLEIELDNTVDVASLMMEVMDKVMAEQEDVPEDLEFDISTANLVVNLTVKGNLMWNPRTGLPHTCSLEGDGSFGIELSASASAEGESQDFEVSVSFAGTMSAEMETE